MRKSLWISVLGTRKRGGQGLRLPTRVRFLLPVLLLLFLLPLPLLADTTYTYTGNPFTVVFSPYTTSDFVSGSFTVAGGPLSCPATCNVSPLSFSFSDGFQTITDLNTIGDTFVIATAINGAFTGWNINLDVPNGEIHTELGVDYGETFILRDNPWGEDVNSPGRWSTTSVPEPSPFILLGSGLAGLAGVIRRKLIK